MSYVTCFFDSVMGEERARKPAVAAGERIQVLAASPGLLSRSKALLLAPRATGKAAAQYPFSIPPSFPPKPANNNFFLLPTSARGSFCSLGPLPGKVLFGRVFGFATCRPWGRLAWMRWDAALLSCFSWRGCGLEPGRGGRAERNKPWLETTRRFPGRSDGRFQFGKALSVPEQHSSHALNAFPLTSQENK